MTTRRRSWWGWGWEDEAVSGRDLEQIAAAIARRPGFGGLDGAILQPLAAEGLDLRPPRVEPPPALAGICTTAPHERAGHTYGKAFRDVVRALRGDVPTPPDVVAFPTTEAEVVDLLDWCSGAGLAAIPYGGGSSVVGGVEPRLGDEWPAAITIDLTRIDRVLEVDRTSRAARIQGGALGPVLEDQLRPHGLTLRHFPQSFEFSTLGGWLATRSGGHFATVYTHIDDLVESLRVVTPSGISESRRLPGSGAGPSPDRLFLGSEGSLGVITEAWMRVQDRVRWKASASARFATLEAAAEACRAISQSALFPTNCRVLDPGEATSAGVTDGTSVLLLGFESADHPVDAWAARAVELVADHGGEVPEGVRSSSTEGAAGTWRNSFIRAPYGRDALTRLGVVVDTFETACTWGAFPALHAGVVSAMTDALERVCGGGSISVRFTHVYPDGPAPYYTVMAPSRPADQLAQWDELKAAAGDALLAHGGTITHHHAVGRDHHPWYDRQRPALVGAALRAAKGVLDPGGILNPGVIVG
ncbi:MAG TPA: FAD-binding oxidoreductase [Acidimicrobiales bacterium]|nr:FAD-binding oxidoreductase [Acidimicrobiales bacterium]